ncbi:MAG: ribose 5-phosphate isomerase A [Clostridiaceae bacterium]
MMEKDLKRASAKEALKYIKNNTLIGLGGGRTISHMVEYIKERGDLNVKVVTPSAMTEILCVKNGLEVLPVSCVDKVDIAFDGCDEVDWKFNALKSGGGIHTKEKLIGSMAEDYVLLVDDSKYVETLTFRHPVVLETLTESRAYIEKKVRELGGEPALRISSSKDGFTVSDSGNLLMDVEFKNVDDIHKLGRTLKNICGVIETSLFVDVATKVIVAGENGIRVISK